MKTVVVWLLLRIVCFGNKLARSASKLVDWVTVIKFKREPEPVIVNIPEDILDEFRVYISRCYSRRVSSFRVSEKMRKYQVGQVVDGYKGQTNKPKRGALLGSFHQSGGGGYFLMRLDNQRIIQVFTVRPVLE